MSDTIAPQPNRKRKREDDPYFDTVSAKYLRLVADKLGEHGLSITEMRAKVFLNDPAETVEAVQAEAGRTVRPGAKRAATDATMAEDEDEDAQDGDFEAESDSDDDSTEDEDENADEDTAGEEERYRERVAETQAAFREAADALDTAQDQAPLPEDFIALPPRVPQEIVKNLVGHRLELEPLDLRAKRLEVSPDDGEEQVVAYQTALAAHQELSVVFAYVNEAKRVTKRSKNKSPVGIDKLSMEPRRAPTFYGATNMEKRAVAKPVATPQLDRIGDLEAYLYDDTMADPSTLANAYDGKSTNMRRTGKQGPHTVALTFTETAFLQRLAHDAAALRAGASGSPAVADDGDGHGDAAQDEEMDHCQDAMQEDDAAQDDAMQEEDADLLARRAARPVVEDALATWSALEGMLTNVALLPDEALEEVEQSISLSKAVPQKSGAKSSGQSKIAKASDGERKTFDAKIAGAIRRVKELFVQVDRAVQAGRAFALQARTAVAGDDAGWSAEEIAGWQQLDAAKRTTTTKLLFEYKNMEPCATYVWNEWRKATPDEMKGKGERSPQHYVAAVLSAGQDPDVETAATEKWAALLDLADHGSKLIDGTDAGLDGKTLWRHIQRELEMVDSETGELSAELVQLCGMFPSHAIQPSKYGNVAKGGKRTAANQKLHDDMVALEKSVVAGTVRQATVRKLLQDKTAAGAFDLREIVDPRRPRPATPPPSIEQAEAKLEERVAYLMEILKQRRARLAAKQAK